MAMMGRNNRGVERRGMGIAPREGPTLIQCGDPPTLTDMWGRQGFHTRGAVASGAPSTDASPWLPDHILDVLDPNLDPM
jgi:hypothetical protein